MPEGSTVGGVTLFCCGDVMTGRGVDQILAHPGDPELREPSVTDARVYVRLAESVNGSIAQPAPDSWPWGDALAAIDAAEPDLRLINLETSITTSADFAPGKSIHYRMHPANIGCLTVARPDVCVLANNHILDFGQQGLQETLETLGHSQIASVGAGLNTWEAAQPARLRAGLGTRLMVIGLGMSSSGVPDDWAAGPDRPGLKTQITEDEVWQAKRSGDIVVVSIHWGSNWGYQAPHDQVRFAHRLVDAGADLIHGHSSHHPRPIEIYRERLILYGCGDLINDYEGIGGYDRYRDDLRLLYFPSLHPTGELAGLRMVPMVARQLSLRRAESADAQWLCATMQRVSAPFGTDVLLTPDGSLEVTTKR